MLHRIRLGWNMEKFYRKSLNSTYLNQMSDAGKRAGLTPTETAQWIMANEYKKGVLKSEFIAPVGMHAISKGLKRMIAEDKALKINGMMDEDALLEANYTERTFYQFETNLKMNIYEEAPLRHDSDNNNPMRTGKDDFNYGCKKRNI